MCTQKVQCSARVCLHSDAVAIIYIGIVQSIVHCASASSYLVSMLHAAAMIAYTLSPTCRGSGERFDLIFFYIERNAFRVIRIGSTMCVFVGEESCTDGRGFFFGG